ncbi:hypothetical protein ACOAOT_14690 [Lacrimispora sp. AGF001]|uniref:hypothetical protein n=1 Tax=Lacrimispora sp. AGF001 TaxID=3401631 RepID=UPI003B42CC3D
MKILCRTLAYIELIFGSIGSIILAYSLGVKFDYPTLELKRDGTATFAIFATAILCVITIWAILYAISEILENQEKIIKILGENSNTNLKDGNTLTSLSFTPPHSPLPLTPKIKTPITMQESININVNTESDEWNLYDAWKCPICKRINEGHEKTCVCGLERTI